MRPEPFAFTQLCQAYAQLSFIQFSSVEYMAGWIRKTPCIKADDGVRHSVLCPFEPSCIQDPELISRIYENDHLPLQLTSNFDSTTCPQGALHSGLLPSH